MTPETITPVGGWLSDKVLNIIRNWLVQGIERQAAGETHTALTAYGEAAFWLNQGRRDPDVFLTPEVVFDAVQNVGGTAGLHVHEFSDHKETLSPENYAASLYRLAGVVLTHFGPVTDTQEAARLLLVTAATGDDGRLDSLSTGLALGGYWPSEWVQVQWPQDCQECDATLLWADLAAWALTQGVQPVGCWTGTTDRLFVVEEALRQAGVDNDAGYPLSIWHELRRHVEAQNDIIRRRREVAR